MNTLSLPWSRYLNSKWVDSTRFDVVRIDLVRSETNSTQLNMDLTQLSMTWVCVSFQSDVGLTRPTPRGPHLTRLDISLNRLDLRLTQPESTRGWPNWLSLRWAWIDCVSRWARLNSAKGGSENDLTRGRSNLTWLYVGPT